MKSSKRLLSRLSLGDMEQMLEAKKRQVAVAPLQEKRAALLAFAARIQKKIDRLMKLSSGKPARAGRPRGHKPDRPPKTVRRGRPAKKAWKMSAAARKRNALAVSRAQKARWAAYRKAKAAKAKARSKPAPKGHKPIEGRSSIPARTSPKPGTLSAKILKVAGPGSEQA